MSNDLLLPSVTYLHSVALRHDGDCLLLGVTPTLHVYVEEVYGADGWLAQHHIGPDGAFIESIDEDSGAQTVTTPLTLPDDAARSRTGWHTIRLNFAGARHRGMRALERVDALVRPFTMQDRLYLADHPVMRMPVPHILGLAESYVLSEALTRQIGLYFVCRRLRIAHVVSPPDIDESGEPYDYDTRALYIAHFAARTHDLDETLIHQIQPLPGVLLHRPMDCAIADDHLLIADGGEAGRTSAVHVWRLEWGPTFLTAEELLLKRIYG